MRLGLGLGLIPTRSRPTVTSAPVSVVLPSISGILTEGQTLTADPGIWSGLPSGSFGYQWQRSGVNIGGATASTRVPTADDVAAGASALTVEVTATNDIGSTTAESAGVTIVAALSISGSPPDCTVGSPYSFTFTVTGGHAPRVSTLTGTLNPGLDYDELTHTIAGTPLSSGTAAGLSIEVEDADGLTDDTGAFDIVCTAGSIPDASLDFSVAANSQYVPLIAA